MNQQANDTPGQFVEIDLDQLHDGEFREVLENAIREGYRLLDEYEKKTGDLKKGKVTGSVAFKIIRNTDDYINFEYEVTVKKPKVKHMAMVRGKGGRLLYPSDGKSDLNDSHQTTLPTFDRFGNPKAVIDTQTGEIVTPENDDGIAGRLKQSM